MFPCICLHLHSILTVPVTSVRILFLTRTIFVCFQTHSGVEYLQVTPSNSLYFPAVDFIRTSVGKAAVKQGSSQLPVIVDCRFILGADFTAAKVCFLSHITSLRGVLQKLSHPTGQEMLHHLCNLKLYYSIHKSHTLAVAS
jgi:hypothetical protein